MLTTFDLNSYRIVEEFGMPDQPDAAEYFRPPSISLAQGPGRHVIVLVNESLVAVDIDSGAEVELVADHDHAVGFQMDVSADGSTMVVVADTVAPDSFFVSEPGIETELQIAIVDLGEPAITSRQSLDSALAFALSEDGSAVVLANGPGGSVLTVYDVEAGSVRSTIDLGAVEVVDSRFGVSSSPEFVLSPDGQRLAALVDGNLLLFDTASGQPVAAVSGHGDVAPVAAAQ